jgi:hypothetical protein
MTPEDAVTAIARTRAPIGFGAWAMPNLAGRLFGLSPRENPQMPYMARLFGARDLALAAGLQLSEGEARRTWVQIGLACDVADAAAALLARRGGYISPATTVLLTAPAVGGALLGLRALQR